MTVLVVGSANRDYILSLDADPVPGGRLEAQNLRKDSGGRGVNQAIVASRMGASVVFAGCIGDDRDGQDILQLLAYEGVDATCVDVHGTVATGFAVVSSHPLGSHSVVVVPGANDEVPASAVDRGVASADRPGSVLLLQGEVSQDVIAYAVETAALGGIRVVVNLAPYRALPESVLARCDPLIVNEIEAEAFLGTPIGSRDDAARAVSDLAETAASAVITLGAGGAVWSRDGQTMHVPAPDSGPVVDVSGAGDAFCGTVAAGLDRGLPLAEAVELAVRIATTVVTRRGVVQAFPSRSEGVGAFPSAD